MGKSVYFFGGGKAEGSSQLRGLLGGKRCELAEMTNLGIRVSPGFTSTTETLTQGGRREPDGPWDEVQHPVVRLEHLLTYVAQIREAAKVQTRSGG